MTLLERDALIAQDERAVFDKNHEYLSFDLVYPEGFRIPEGFRFAGIATPKIGEWYIGAIDGRTAHRAGDLSLDPAISSRNPTRPRVLLTKKKEK